MVAQINHCPHPYRHAPLLKFVIPSIILITIAPATRIKKGAKPPDCMVIVDLLQCPDWREGFH